MSADTVLVTGGAGFIGPQVVQLLLEETDYRVIVIDKLTYAARVENGEPYSLKLVLDRLSNRIDLTSRYSFVQWDICDPHITELLEAAKVDYVINMAAESHVDRSIGDTAEFILTEIHGTRNLLEAIRKQNAGRGKRVKRAVFVSTDEVYGSIDRMAGYEGDQWYALSDDAVRNLIHEYQFTEATPLGGGSPYAACKGGADLLVLAYANTYRWNRETGERDPERMPVIITRCVNNFGPFQHPEKLIPLAICTLLAPEVNNYQRHIPVYDEGLAVREWLHTEDHARAILHVLQHGQIGEIYNVGSGNRRRNLDILRTIFEACRGRTDFRNLKEATFDATRSGGVARPGHDLCYAVNSTKLQQLDPPWQPRRAGNLEAEIRGVVEWYIDHAEWWRPIWTSSEFTDYWDQTYRRIQDSAGGPLNF
ncbi:MAG: GDP-mannose 4,6-dehydratase [Deltaproteobacteria bacterium]|nr:GDP-mannose 4,6-dehydratase [Deltaproteobacteria bacterium]